MVKDHVEETDRLIRQEDGDSMSYFVGGVCAGVLGIVLFTGILAMGAGIGSAIFYSLLIAIAAFFICGIGSISTGIAKKLAHKKILRQAQNSLSQDFLQIKNQVDKGSGVARISLYDKVLHKEICYESFHYTEEIKSVEYVTLLQDIVEQARQLLDEVDAEIVDESKNIEGFQKRLDVLIEGSRK